MEPENEEVYFWQKRFNSYYWFNTNFRANKHCSQKIYSTIKDNGKVLFISTKKQASEAISDLAKDTDQYYVNYRWLGGMLTNWGTISNSIKKLEKINQDLSSENRGFTKKELLKMSIQRDKLQRSLGGISAMKKYLI